jgi:hypothetical protein
VVEPPPPPAPTTDRIDFDRGSARITNVAKARLDGIALRLRENPRAPVVITGYPENGTAPAGSRSRANGPRTPRRTWWTATASMLRASRRKRT